MKFSKILLTKEQIDARTEQLAEMIDEEFSGEEIVIIGVLKGACVFLIDLMRKLKTPCKIDFMAVSSYGSSTKSSGVVKIVKDLELPVEDKNVLIVEDIIDSGLTLSYLVDNFKRRNCKKLKIVTLLDKPERRVVDLKPDFTGFEIPDEFVVGYGLDYNEHYRNLEFIAILDEESL